MAETKLNLGADITFSPRWWSFIASTRIFVASFIGHTNDDDGISDRVAMAAHELLENAAKYSRCEDSLISCSFVIDEARRQIRLKVQNEADPKHLHVLHDELAIVNEGDPLDMYVKKMQASATSEGSQLGLARIRYEGNARLSLTTENGIVVLEATFEMPARERIEVA